MVKNKKTIVLLIALFAYLGSAGAHEPQDTPNDPPPAGRSLSIETVDGVVIDAVLYSGGAPDVVIYCHRLLGGKSGEETERLRAALLGKYDLIAFDFRGHKASFGASTAGGDEILDLRAIITFARRSNYRYVYALGAGMGANVAWRTAAVFGNIDGIVAISPSGFAPEISPLLVRLVSDKALETSFGKVPLRIAANTRIGLRYTAGFPSDLSALALPVPSLVINAERDRLVSLDRLKLIFEDLPVPAAITVVPGRRHGEDLITDETLREVRAFLDGVSAGVANSADLPAGDLGVSIQADSSAISFTGDMPLSDQIMFRELHRRLPSAPSAARTAFHSPTDIQHTIEDILAMHGYTKATVSLALSSPRITFAITAPRIESATIEGNRWLSDDYLNKIASIGNDYYNAYELDVAVRRLSAEPAVTSVKPVVSDRPDGNVDIRLVVKEQRPYRVAVSTKFTEVDDFVGLGLRWNEFNPTGIQYEGRAMMGMADHDVLTDHRVSKSFLAGTLRASTALFDNIKSRDDLEYKLTRQEVREVGGDFVFDYRLSPSIAVGVGGFAKRYRSAVAEDMPVEKGGAGGYQLRLDLSGRFPLRGRPRLAWRHTVEYQRVGVAGVGDFAFEALQLNLGWKTDFFDHHRLETLLRWGRIHGAAPPQEQYSLGGMTSLPGYEDDAFVNTRVFLVGQAILLSARGLFDERSVWAPLRLVLSAHAGLVWGAGEEFRPDDLRMDAGFEFDYLETLRAGVVWPVGGTREGGARVYLGWGTHVY